MANGTKLPLRQIARRYPGSRGAEFSHPANWTRWILKGIVGVDGTRHKLRATKFGRTWLVDPADAEAFFAALSETPDPAPSVPTATERRRSVEAAERELELAGA